MERSPLLKVYNALLPAARVGLAVAPIFSEKLARRGREAALSLDVAVREVDRLRSDGRRVLLCHAASAGEFEQIKPVLRRIDRKRHILVLSFFSPTIRDTATESDLADAACYHPLDFRRDADRFFARMRPGDYLITRHDLWPNHLAAARRAGARTVLINANLHARSLRLRPWAMPATRAVFSLLDRVLTGSERLRARLAAVVDPGRIEVTGDTRLDQVWERARSSGAPPVLPGSFLDRRRVLVLGSVLKSDERVLFAGFRRAFARPDASIDQRMLSLLHVPHEVGEREIGRIVSGYSDIGLAACRYSRLDRFRGERVIVVDRVGILPELYAHGPLAYVGGGFGAGVHSVIEPAAHGAAVAFGPRIEILDEALDLAASGVGIMIRSAGDIEALLDLARDDARLESARRGTRRYVETRIGAADRVVKSLF